MSFMYPRTITIKRGTAQTGVGAVPYGGSVAADEQVILSGVPASIQNTRTGRSTKDELPSGVPVSTWRIFYRADETLVRERDLIYDDLGRRFRVIAANPHSLGYSSACELLEV